MKREYVLKFAKGYLYVSIIFIVISLILYFTKGDPSTCSKGWGCITNTQFMIRLYWATITVYIGIGSFFVSQIIFLITNLLDRED